MAGSFLSTTNYSKGLLVDHEAMGGVSEDPSHPGRYMAFLVNYLTGENIGAHSFASLEEALNSINSLNRTWTFEASGGCAGDGGCSLKDNGTCDACGNCHLHDD